MSKHGYKPTDNQRIQVKAWAAAGVSKERMRKALGIDIKTLNKHFDFELQNAQTEVTALAMSKLVSALNAGQAWAVCFYLKCREDWQEKAGITHTGEVRVKRVLGVSEEDI